MGGGGGESKLSSLSLCPSGFTALDLTVACVTEVMWMFVLLDNSFIDMVFEYTLKFILTPVSHHYDTCDIILCCFQLYLLLFGS